MIIYLKKRMLLLFSLVIFLLSIFSQNYQTNSDPKGTLLTSQSIIETGSIKLNNYKTDSMTWHLYEQDGNKYYAFPLGASISSIPIVWIANKVFLLDMNNEIHDKILQKVISSILAVGIFFFLFKIASLYFEFNIALIISFLFWLGTSLSSTLVTALWNQNFSTLYSAVAIYISLLIIHKNRDELWPYLSIFLFMAYFSRPTLSLLSIGIVVFLFSNNKKLLSFKISILIFLFLGLFVFFSYMEYSQILPPYYMPKRLASETFLIALYGNLLSPSRGLFIFSPFLLLIIINSWILINIFKKNKPMIIILILILSHLIIISKFPHWWAGGSYGPRFMIDILIPLFLIFSILLKEVFLLNGIRYSLNLLFLTISFIISIWIHSYQGLYNKYTIKWFLEPNIDKYPEYLFDWKYPQFLHNKERHIERLKEHNKNLKANELPSQNKDLQFNLKANELASQIGIIDGNSRKADSKIDKSGYLTFGPYVELLAGNYKFNILYESSQNNNIEVGFWDIAINQEVISQDKIYGTNSKEINIVGQFTIPESSNKNIVEIRNYYNGTGDLTIKNLTITRVY